KTAIKAGVVDDPAVDVAQTVGQHPASRRSPLVDRLRSRTEALDDHVKHSRTLARASRGRPFSGRALLRGLGWADAGPNMNGNHGLALKPAMLRARLRWTRSGPSPPPAQSGRRGRLRGWG